ncbi:unnamed protein product [Pleuronectes platessa]|uniref:Uncharacterized protein n=1 Tax=Pleuronectes platessa TaxID=8262 RepID=A0A9N7Z775_PLEPL|nr:unnamed protein product [Pleuronectes platessa]
MRTQVLQFVHVLEDRRLFPGCDPGFVWRLPGNQCGDNGECARIVFCRCHGNCRGGGPELRRMNERHGIEMLRRKRRKRRERRERRERRKRSSHSVLIPGNPARVPERWINSICKEASVDEKQTHRHMPHPCTAAHRWMLGSSGWTADLLL